MTVKVIKSRASEARDTVNNITKNLVEQVQASSLVIVAAYAGYAVKTEQITGPLAWVLAAAASIIAVRGAYELLKSFNKS